MIRLLKYRTPLLALVLTFALFDIGLPVVLDTCPMEKAFGAGACRLCHHAVPSDGVEIRLPGGSCCTPTRIVERNTTEFEQSRPARDREVRQHMIPPLFCTVSQPLDLVLFTPETWSPPDQADIPILTSSLLI